MRRVAMPVAAALAMIPLLSGCFGPPPVLASSKITQAAMIFQKPPADRARISIFTGRGPLFTGGTTPQVSHILPADIYVDDVKIGTVNPKEAMVFDVAAGKHSFAWMIYNVKPGPGLRMQPCNCRFAWRGHRRDLGRIRRGPRIS